MAQQIIFYVLAVVIVVFSILSVTSRRILRAATYLLFVLLATAGLYMLMEYQFLFGVQISVYAGGIMSFITPTEEMATSHSTEAVMRMVVFWNLEPMACRG